MSLVFWYGFFNFYWASVAGIGRGISSNDVIIISIFFLLKINIKLQSLYCLMFLKIEERTETLLFYFILLSHLRWLFVTGYKNRIYVWNVSVENRTDSTLLTPFFQCVMRLTIITITFTMYITYYSKHFTYISSFNPI